MSRLLSFLNTGTQSPFCHCNCQSQDSMQRLYKSARGLESSMLATFKILGALFFMWYSSRFSQSSFNHTFRHSSKTYLRIALGSWRQPPHQKHRSPVNISWNIYKKSLTTPLTAPSFLVSKCNRAKYPPVPSSKSLFFDERWVPEL